MGQLARAKPLTLPPLRGGPLPLPPGEVLQGLANTGYHAHEILHVPHFLDLLDLLQEIVKAELVLGDLLAELPGLLLIELLLRALH